MHTYQVTDSTTCYKRITKRLAKILLGNGHTIAVCPNKLRPGLPFAPHVYLDLARIVQENTTLEKILTNIKFYNCSYETGYYLSFYQLTELQPLQITNKA